MKKIAFFICLYFFLQSCKLNSNNSAESINSKADVLAVNMDTSVRPTEDFFMYANGGWIKNNAIPAEQSSWGIGNLVIEENYKRLREISEAAGKENAAKGTTSQKIGDFWATAMDSTKTEQTGLKPLQPWFDKINSITDAPSLINVSNELNTIGVDALFGDFVQQDDKNSDVMSYKLWQGGIGLPDREYYFKTDSSTVNIRNKYVKHITKMLTLQGQDSATASKAASAIFALETKLAKASRKIEDLRDPYANYHKMAIKDLNKISSTIDWKTSLANRGIKNVDSVIVGQPEFFTALDQVIKTTPVDDWKNYLRFRTVRNFEEVLPDAFGVEGFSFNKLLSGAKERKPRWKRVMQMEENQMGELLGQLYVKEFFNETAKKRYSDLVESIRDAYKERIEKLTWMSDSTKQKALVKLAAIKKKVGYPNKWKDFSAMDISTENYLQNVINANKWWHNFYLKKLGKPVDRDEWEMTPQTYNAYYNPSNNEIVLPAGIFTIPGYHDEDIDDATVYGYAGASTIGHEITHGFDDQGRLYDEKGNLKNWWTKNDSTEFASRAQMIIHQFNLYEPLPGSKINGKATQGENIADLGGILLGIDAFKKTEQYKKNEKLAGLTPMQRYFLGYALGWLGQIRDENLKTRLMTDVHSPAKYRVNGPFVDVDEFYSTFAIKEGDKMFVPDSLRVKIW
jgi:putative endopeptidase